MEDDPTTEEGFQTHTVSNPTKLERKSLRSLTEPTRLSGERYRIGERIGRGGMGEVIAAHDEQIDRPVAIKRMRDANPSDNQIQRFVREAQIQGQLEHPAIVPVHELGRDLDGLPYFAMKKLAGTTLAEILAAGDTSKYPRQRLLRAFADTCLAIELAHTRGILHRDIKPENLILGDFGETYVLDWGVAKRLGELDESEGRADSVETAIGTAVGTAGYMAPEQVRGERALDARADVYSLGCVLFEILAGKRLHPRGQAGLTSALEGVEARPSVRAPDRTTPPELDALCARATATDRADRIATARELGESVQRFLDGDRDLELRRTLALHHLETATAAFAANDRRVAMREAGLAIALDPTLRAAAELISRLMLEPPHELPAEVTNELEIQSQGILRRRARMASLTNLGYLLFIPLLAASGSDSWYLVAIAALTLVNAGILYYMSRPGVAFVAWPIVVLNSSVIVVIGRLFSPFLLGIPLATAMIVGVVAGANLSRRGAVAVAVTLWLAVVGPWLAERAGLLATTIDVGDGTMRLHSPIFTSEVGSYVILAVCTAVIIVAMTLMTGRMRQTERTARQHLHVQAWQLRQLVADRT